MAASRRRDTRPPTTPDDGLGVEGVPSRTVRSVEAIAARLASVVWLVQYTVWGLALLAALGASTFVVAIGLFGDWSQSALVLAVVLGCSAAVAPIILVRFGYDLGPVRRLPEVRAAEVKAAAGALGTKLRAGERRFVESHGLGRVIGLGAVLWDLRRDLEALKEGGLAPAAALVETMVPTRLIRVGFSAVAAPILLALGSMSLLFALLMA